MCERIEASEFAWDELREWIESERAVEFERSLRSALRVVDASDERVGFSELCESAQIMWLHEHCSFDCFDEHGTSVVVQRS
jgi:hypothetical protein